MDIATITPQLFSLTLFTITTITLLISSYTDLKTREVPDIISYGLIFTALGVRLIFSPILGWHIFFAGLFGFLITLVLALFFYYTNQWGGADSKLLMAMGAVLGLSFPLTLASLPLLYFLIALLLIGAIYGFFWIFVQAFLHKKTFLPEFSSQMKEHKTFHYVTLALLIMLGVASFYSILFLPLAVLPIISFYLLMFIAAAEKTCFIREISPAKLTEGDWLAKPVTIDNKVVLSKKTLEAKHIKELQQLFQENKLKTVLIKEGVPFVPSFLFAYLTVIFADQIFPWFLGFFGF